MVATIPATLRAFLLPYAEHFRERGWRVDAAASHTAGDELLGASFDAVHEVPVSRSIRDVVGLLRAERALRSIIRAGDYHLVHVHTPIASFLTRLAIRRLPRQLRPAVAYTAHGFHFHRGGALGTNLAFRALERLAGRWTDRLVVINEEDHEAALRHGIVPRERLVYMPGIGIDTRRYSPEAVSNDAVAAAREALEVPEDAPLFVLVGEFSRNKRHVDALDALARLRRRDAVLVFAGAERGRDRVVRLAARRGLSERVRFAGFVGDVRPLIRASVALVLPSRREGLARSVMEALALEVPVVVSTARGNRELVGSEAGFIVGTGDVAAMAERMDWLVDHPEERAEMGRRGRERMTRRFDLRRLLAQHEELYGAMLAERAGNR